jgi:hypothetical protein
MNIRCRGRKVFEQIASEANRSIRNIAQKIGISKSSVDRHKASIKKRNIFAESYFWETEEGYRWLCHLYFSVILFFGIHCSIGGDKLSAFFQLIRIDKHVGTSPSKIKEIAAMACDLLEEYRKQQEKASKMDKPIKVIGGIDETYFRAMILVLMDLPSGYIFVEEESDDKSYETWFDRAKKVAKRFNIEFKFFVSDRAQQLIKLATQGFSCPSIPDLFHASNELAKLFGLSLNRKKAQIQKQLANALVKLETLKELSKDISAQQVVVKELKAQESAIDKGISAYKDILYTLSLTLHPFNIACSSVMNSAQIESELNLLLIKAEALKAEHDISSKTDHLQKFKNQIQEMAELVDTWWLLVNESLNFDELDGDLILWLTQYLLPALYWQKQAARTKNPDLKEEYRYAAEKAESKLKEHPLTQTYLANEEWVSWANQMVSNFQRTSSAVEGRNGWLTQMHHNGRGLTPNRLKAQTILHNYYLKRGDGTTAAERLFKREFPDPFIWVIERMGDIPMPRSSVRRCQT